MSVTRKLAAILYADVAGYSRLTGADEVGTHQQLSASLDLITQRITKAGGRVVHYAGDAVLAEFASVVTAVETALDVQASLAALGAEVDVSKRLQYRIGVNLGEVIVDRDDVYGDGVNIAARLEGQAPVGGVCVSEDVYRQVNGKITAQFQDMGAQDLKNIDGKVRAYSVNVGPDAGVSTEHTELELPDKPSIAVLPFDNMSGDPEQEYFSDGVSEDIITALSRIHSIFVIARNSSFVFKNTAQDIKQVGTQLGVRYVLEGSVRKSSSRVRITAQLIDATSGVHLWAQRYDRVLEDVFDLQDEITDTIVAAIHPELEVAERERARNKSANDLDAWDCYQRGMWHGYAFDRDGAEKAEQFFNEALTIAPQYAPALAGLSWLDFQRVILSFTPDGTIPREYLVERGLGRALSATRVDDRDAFAQYVFGRLLSIKGEFDEGIERLKRAIDVNPNYALAYHGLGYAYALGGMPKEAVAQFDTALRLSPRDSYRWALLTMRAFSLMMCGDYEEAVEWGRRARLVRPDQFWCYSHSVIALVQLGRHEEAEQTYADLLAVKPDFSLATIDYTIRFKHAADREFCINSLRQVGLKD